MSNRLHEIKRRRLQERVNTLLREYEAVSEQLETELDAGNQVKLRRRLDNLEKRVTETEDGLSRIEAVDPLVPSNRFHDQVVSQLPKIDFSKVVPVIEALLRDPADCVACALLFQQSLQMGGQLCSARIRDLLDDWTRDFKHWTIRFPAGGRADEIELLDRLAEYLNVDAREDPNEYADVVVRTICGSLQNGSVVLMEFRNWDYVEPPDRVFEWFLRFWNQLLQGLAQTANSHRKVRLLASIFVDSHLPSTCLQMGRTCTVEALDQSKILELPLEPWTLADIRDWVARYTEKNQLADQIASRIARVTSGLPVLVEKELRDELEN